MKGHRLSFVTSGQVLLLGILIVHGHAQSAEIQLPDKCNQGVCLTNLIWKAGHMNHSFSGILKTARTLESVEVQMHFSDGNKELDLEESFRP